MKLMLALVVVAAGLLGSSSAASEPYPASALALRDGLKALTYVACYSSAGSLTFNDDYTWQSQGYCQLQCVSLTGGTKYPVIATSNSTQCWCGEAEPSASDKVDDSKCSSICAGYDLDKCGADGFYSVWLTGETLSSGSGSSSTAGSSSSPTSTPSPTTAASPSVVTVGGKPVTVTATAAASSGSSSSSKSSSSGPNKAAIAAGIVVGLVLVGAVVGGGYLFMRHRRRKQIEAEYQRNAAVSSFIGGGKPASSSGANSFSNFSDPRIDPTISQRRMSDGSIADNQDYSRRILKVTNA